MKVFGLFSLILAGLLLMINANAMAAGKISAVPAAAPWSGAYVGAQVGSVWEQENWQYTNPNYFNTLGATLLGNDFRFNLNGVIGGGLAGVNYQIGPWVIGVEGAYSGSSLKTSKASPFFATDIYSTQTNQFAWLKGRLGYAYQRWLVYGSGGWATENINLALRDPIAMINAAKNQWPNGWVAGFGLEYKMAANFSVGLTYDHTQIDIKKQSIRCPSCGNGVGLGTPVTNAKLRTDSIMARLTYQFWGLG